MIFNVYVYVYFFYLILIFIGNVWILVGGDYSGSWPLEGLPRSHTESNQGEEISFWSRLCSSLYKFGISCLFTCWKSLSLDVIEIYRSYKMKFFVIFWWKATKPNKVFVSRSWCCFGIICCMICSTVLCMCRMYTKEVYLL